MISSNYYPRSVASKTCILAPQYRASTLPKSTLLSFPFSTTRLLFPYLDRDRLLVDLVSP